MIRKAVIPIAGLGTRLFPASHAVKKELFPVVGQDGIARALFHYHLLELAAAGIEDVCIIVQPGEDALVRDYLRGPDEDYLRRLAKSPALLREAEQMRIFSERVTFAVQHEQEGYGHAVYQTKAFAAGEMVLVCLGDHLFRGKERPSVLGTSGGEKARQQDFSPYAELAEAAGASKGRSVSAVNRIGAAELGGFGTIGGTRCAESPRLIDVSLIIEKPDVATAREKLRVDGLPAERWLGWFGMHALAPSIFDVLEQMIRDNIRDKGEFQLTRAQDIQRQREGYLALEMMDAERFDFGTPDDFVRSLQRFRGW
jgi:UTP--glucose-1-phosphate uridylyltransferase